MVRRPRIATVTVHAAISYGAVLQAYALQRVLRGLGADTEVLDYRNPTIEGKNRPWPRRTENSLARRMKDLLALPFRVGRNRRFTRFASGYLRRSPVTFRSLEDLDGIEDDYDALIVGSDQVWSPKHAGFDPVYFLTFVRDGSKKYSYAASFGRGEITSDLVDEYRQRLGDFNVLSVRETTGKQIINTLLDRDADVDLDPTMLLPSTHWRSLAATRNLGHYVFVFEVNGVSATTRNLAKAIARSKGDRVVSLTQTVRSLGDLVAHQAGPSELLGYIANADFVLTDSFHGVVFSILFHRDFLLRPAADHHTNDRMMHLLNALGLGTRADLRAWTSPIDWDAVDEVLDCKRKASEGRLRRVVATLEQGLAVKIGGIDSPDLQ
jgi:hypothetical protein